MVRAAAVVAGECSLPRQLQPQSARGRPQQVLPERAEIWADASSVLSGIKLLFGIDPKADYRDKVADVRLN